MKYTHEQRAALHIARAEKAQARADAAKMRARLKVAAIVERAEKALTAVLGQLNDGDFEKTHAVRDRLRALYQETINGN